LLFQKEFLMQITYYGHACFEVKVNNKRLLFDPFITPNKLAERIDFKSIKPDYVLVSHGHNDHIADAIAISKQSDAVFISNFEITNWLSAKGIRNVHPMNLGGKFDFDFGTVKYFIAQHSSSMPDGSYGGNPGGFLIKGHHDKSFYFAGDTGLTYDLKLIREYISIDFAFLPIGNNFTMGVDNAMIASEFINCDKIIGMHYDTFDIIKIDKKVAVEKFNRAGKELILLEIGETINL
jgi:L-ascorbate metabolism protein UlaG (beta-lactamase superfamily)